MEIIWCATCENGYITQNSNFHLNSLKVQALLKLHICLVQLGYSRKQIVLDLPTFNIAVTAFKDYFFVVENDAKKIIINNLIFLDEKVIGSTKKISIAN